MERRPTSASVAWFDDGTHLLRWLSAEHDLLAFDLVTNPNATFNDLNPVLSLKVVASTLVVFKIDSFTSPQVSNENHEGKILWWLDRVGARFKRSYAGQYMAHHTRKLILLTKRAVPVPGHLPMSPEEIEAYQLLGARLPLVTEKDDDFIAWVLEREGRL